MIEEGNHRDSRTDLPSNKAVGLIFAAAFALIAIQPLLNGLPFRAWAIAASSALLLASLFAPSLLAPLHWVCLELWAVLRWATVATTFGVAFFLIVTPVGLLMRAVKRDPLKLRFDPSLPSYWIERKPPGPTPDSLRKQS